jgi:hypothetical protein
MEVPLMPVRAATRRCSWRNKKTAVPAGTAAPGPVLAPVTWSGARGPQNPASTRRGRQRIHIAQDTQVWFIAAAV